MLRLAATQRAEENPYRPKDFCALDFHVNECDNQVSADSSDADSRSGDTAVGFADKQPEDYEQCEVLLH
jgi:hypothetical protein